MNVLQKVREEYSEVMKMDSGYERDQKLSELMDELHREYQVPLLMDWVPAWIEEDPSRNEVFNLYRMIADSRDL